MGQAEVGALRVVLSMDAAEFMRSSEKVQSQLDAVSRRMADFGDKMNRIGLTMSAAITAPLAALGAMATRSAATFEKSMANIATIVDTSAESMAAMGKEVMNLSKTLPVGLADLTTALYDIRSAGIQAGDAMNVLDKSAKLAVAGLGTVQESADIATSAMNAFGLQGAEVDRMFSNVFATTQFGKTTIAQLSQGFGAVAGTVAQAGVKLDEYLASVAALTTTGLPAAEAHTQIRAAIAGLTRESEIGKKVLDTLGAETFKDLIEQSGGMVGAFEKIRATLQGNDANIIKLLGSVEAYNALISLTGGIFVHLEGQTFGRDQVRQLITHINDAVRDGARLVVSQ
jgi:TP901 family phage tail tape measure protein